MVQPPTPIAWPKAGWELTAAESVVLRHAGTEADPAIVGRNAFRLAVTELVARQVLRLDRVQLADRLVGGRRVALLSDGPRMTEMLEPALASVLDRYEWLRERRLRVGDVQDDALEVTGVLVKDLVTSESLRNNFCDFLFRDVGESLRRRGFLTEAFERTAAGDEAEQSLDGWIELGRIELATHAADEAWVSAYLRGAGAAVLLVGSAYSTLAEIGRARPLSGDGPAMAVALSFIDGIDLSGLDGMSGMLAAGFADGGGGGDGGGF